MKTSHVSLAFAAPLLLLGTCFSTGCESPGGGYGPGYDDGYYGSVMYDPWYHGHYDYDDDYNVIVTPPPASGGLPPSGGDSSVRPEHPIAYPPGEMQPPPSASQLPSSRPPSASTRPAPSIPSRPRAAPRGGGGRR